MSNYMTKMVSDFEEKCTLNNSAVTPASINLFENNKQMAEDFHMFTAKGHFACKLARPDTATAILVLLWKNVTFVTFDDVATSIFASVVLILVIISMMLYTKFAHRKNDVCLYK